MRADLIRIMANAPTHVNPFVPSPATLRCTDAGQDWLCSYTAKLNGAVPTSFFARDVWAEILSILAAQPADSETLWTHFERSRLSHYFRRTELRYHVELLLSYGYLEAI